MVRGGRESHCPPPQDQDTHQCQTMSVWIFPTWATDLLMPFA